MEKNIFERKHTQDNFVTEKIDIVKNKLLGNYDENGNYSIAPQIVNELLELKKTRKSSYENSMFCVGNLLGYGEIDFEVSFDKNVDQNQQAKVFLYVLEGVDKINGYLQNTIKTLIAQFSSNVDNFIEESYKKFKITTDQDDNDEEGKEYKDLNELNVDDSYILAKKAYMLLLEKLEDEKMLDAYGKLFTEKLSTLTKLDSEFAKALLEKFNSQYELIEDIFLKDKNYKALNELFDACFEQVSGTNIQFEAGEKEFTDLVSPAVETFTTEIDELSHQAETQALDMLETLDRNKLEEMNESVHSREDLADIDNDSTDDGAVEIEPELKSFDEQFEGDVHSDILDNPILYEDYDKTEEQSESSEEEKSESGDITEQNQSSESAENLETSIEPQQDEAINANDELIPNIDQLYQSETTVTDEEIQKEVDDISEIINSKQETTTESVAEPVESENIATTSVSKDEIPAEESIDIETPKTIEKLEEKTEIQESKPAQPKEQIQQNDEIKNIETLENKPNNETAEKTRNMSYLEHIQQLRKQSEELKEQVNNSFGNKASQTTQEQPRVDSMSENLSHTFDDLLNKVRGDAEQNTHTEINNNPDTPYNSYNTNEPQDKIVDVDKNIEEILGRDSTLGDTNLFERVENTINQERPNEILDNIEPESSNETDTLVDNEGNAQADVIINQELNQLAGR